MVTFEFMHTLNNKRFDYDLLIALKVDMNKAYDRAEWSFLQYMMNEMDFAHQWILLITLCIL